MLEIAPFCRVAVVVACLLCVSSPAVAESAAEGYVVRIDGQELIFNLGSRDGVTPGAELLVFRKVVVEHPVSSKKISDRFPIGSVTLQQVGERLSISKSWRNLTAAPSVGDYARYEPPVADTPRPSVTAKKSESVTVSVAPPPAVAADVRALEKAFRSTLGRALPDRVRIWEEWLEAYPNSELAPRVAAETTWVRATMDALTRQDSAKTVVAHEDPGIDAALTMPMTVLESDPIEVNVVTRDDDRVDRMRLHAKRIGDPTFKTTEMRRTGDFSWTGDVADELKVADDKVEVFVDVVRTDGQLQVADETRQTYVRPDPKSPERTRNRSRANLLYEFVDFRLGEGEDNFHRVEAEFRYSVRNVVNGFTAGAGVLRGSGASVAALDAGEEARALNLSYAYGEIDFAPLEFVGISGRLLIGNKQQLGVEGSILEEAFGTSVELRLGREEDTRLLLGVAGTDAIGSEAWIELYIEAIERIPMSGEVVVTDLPVGEDLGVSLNYGVGRELTDWLTVMARVGWNARTIFHYGLSGGVNTRFHW